MRNRYTSSIPLSKNGLGEHLTLVLSSLVGPIPTHRGSGRQKTAVPAGMTMSGWVGSMEQWDLAVPFLYFMIQEPSESSHRTRLMKRTVTRETARKFSEKNFHSVGGGLQGGQVHLVMPQAVPAHPHSLSSPGGIQGGR